MHKYIPTEDMMMKMLASHPSSCVTLWQAYEINGYTYYTKEKERRSVAQNNGICIEAFDPIEVKTTYYGYIQDIWELDYDVRLQIPIFKCQCVKHLNGMSMDNYGLTLVDLKNIGHKDDPWVLADRVAQVFYVLDPETGKHVLVSAKQKNVEVEKMEDNNEDNNQFEEMSLFTNPINIKHIEKDFDKNLIPYMWKGDNEKFVWKICIIFHIHVGIYLYGFEFVSYFLPILNVSLSYALYRSSFLFVLLRSRAIVLETKLKTKFFTKLKTTVVIQTNLKTTLRIKFK
jgi:hypothetical protein